MTPGPHVGFHDGARFSVARLGVTGEHPVARTTRDAGIDTIVEGISENQRPVIARSVSGAPIR